MLKKKSDEKIEDLKVAAAEYLEKELKSNEGGLNDKKMEIAVKVLELK